MPKYKIDKHVPFLESITHWGELNHRIKKDWIYDCLFEMEIGDSIFFDDFAQANVFRSRAYSYWCRGYFDHNFVLRSVEGGYRVWRLADRKRPEKFSLSLDDN